MPPIQIPDLALATQARELASARAMVPEFALALELDFALEIVLMFALEIVPMSVREIVPMPVREIVPMSVREIAPVPALDNARKPAQDEVPAAQPPAFRMEFALQDCWDRAVQCACPTASYFVAQVDFELAVLVY